MINKTKNLPPSILYEKDIKNLVSLIASLLKVKNEKVNTTFYVPLYKGKFGEEGRIHTNNLNDFLMQVHSPLCKGLGEFMMVAEWRSGSLISVRLTKSDAKVRIRCEFGIQMEEIYSELLSFFNERKNKLGWLRKDTALLGYLGGIAVVFLAAIFTLSRIEILFKTSFVLSVIITFLYILIIGVLIEKNPYTRMMLKAEVKSDMER